MIESVTFCLIYNTTKQAVSELNVVIVYIGNKMFDIY